MGNIAVIKTDNSNVGVYLHWDGGRDSVEPFLAYCKLKGYRSPDTDCYGWARLCQVIGNFFGGSTSLGIDEVSRLDCDNYDNGTYIIKGWDIVRREYFNGNEQQEYDFMEMLNKINEAQPVAEQIDKRLFTSEKVKQCDLVVGDEVFVQNHRGDWEVRTVFGIGENVRINGHCVDGVPYTDTYGRNNINSYLLKPFYRRVPQK